MKPTRAITFLLPTALPDGYTMYAITFNDSPSEMWTQEEFNGLVAEELITAGPSITAQGPGKNSLRWSLVEGKWQNSLDGSTDCKKCGHPWYSHHDDREELIKCSIKGCTCDVPGAEI